MWGVHRGELLTECRTMSVNVQRSDDHAGQNMCVHKSKCRGPGSIYGSHATVEASRACIRVGACTRSSVNIVEDTRAHQQCKGVYQVVYCECVRVCVCAKAVCECPCSPAPPQAHSSWGGGHQRHKFPMLRGQCP